VLAGVSAPAFAFGTVFVSLLSLASCTMFTIALQDGFSVRTEGATSPLTLECHVGGVSFRATLSAAAEATLRAVLKHREEPVDNALPPTPSPPPVPQFWAPSFDRNHPAG